MLKRQILFLFTFIFAFSLASAQETVKVADVVDLQMIQKIKQEAFQNSKLMETIFYLADLNGPRLTGSPNFRKAAEWAREQLKEWGIQDVTLEEWGTFGRGWTMEKVSLEMTEPQYMPVIAYPKAWTASTNGIISGSPLLLDVNTEEDLEKYKDSLSNRIVMLGKPREYKMRFEDEAKRLTGEELADLAKAAEPGEKPEWWAEREKWIQMRRFYKKVNELARQKGAALILQGSERQHGTVRLTDSGSHELNGEAGLPALVVATEHYGRIFRLLEKKIKVNLRAEVKTRFYDQDSVGFNLIAEIPGTDKKLKKEIVMLGAHLDSWHAGTGVADNGGCCAIMMEAVRILQALEVKPKRTIRLALWAGEEQGFLGSRGYVAKHFGDRKTMNLKPEHADFSIYFNLDNGVGKIRGIYLQGNDAARPVFESWFKPFIDMGAGTITIRNTGGTDHISFNEIGLPGFQFVQDDLDYMPRAHHTNMDVYERVIPADVMDSAVIIASFVYNAAMRDEKMPRKELPKPDSNVGNDD
jgi:carboxypeptidase Q